MQWFKKVPDEIIFAKFHVEYLLKKHGIVNGVEKQLHGGATPITRVVNIPEINSLGAYAIALHEIGHILTLKRKTTNRHSSQVTKSTLANEAKAWAKARTLSMLGWNKEMQDQEEKGYQSYVSAYDFFKTRKAAKSQGGSKIFADYLLKYVTQYVDKETK